MPWNEPGQNGNNNQQDPWGGKRDQNPPDLDKLMSDFIKKVRAFFGQSSNNKNAWQPSGKKELGFGAGIVLLVIFLLWFFAGFFIVNPAEEAVVLRWGKYHDVLQPG